MNPYHQFIEHSLLKEHTNTKENQYSSLLVNILCIIYYSILLFTLGTRRREAKWGLKQGRISKHYFKLFINMLTELCHILSKLHFDLHCARVLK